MLRRMPGYLHEEAVTYHNLTALYHQMGRQEAARRCLEEAERALSKLFGPEHERTQVVRDALRRLRGTAS